MRLVRFGIEMKYVEKTKHASVHFMSNGIQAWWGVEHVRAPQSSRSWVYEWLGFPPVFEFASGIDT